MNRLLNLAIKWRLASRTWRLETEPVEGSSGLTRTRRVYGWRIGPAFGFRSRARRPDKRQGKLFG